MTNLIFLFDGTQNGLDDEHPTNIRIISELVNVPGQEVFYFEGPGNDERNILEHLLGSAFGLGMGSTRGRAFIKLERAYTKGDKIFVFGFSRGAANSRKFCQMLAVEGYEVEFLGCFDTVFAVLPFGKYQQETLFGDLNVSGLVKNARHAVALDEDRMSFAPNLMNARPGVLEMWFKGNHADIGGGYKDRGFADRTLAWMLSEAAHSADLVFQPYDYGKTPKVTHREDLPYLRYKRTPVVMVDDEISDVLKPDLAIYITKTDTKKAPD